MGWYGGNMDLFSSALQEFCKHLLGISSGLMAQEVGAGILITASAIAGFDQARSYTTSRDTNVRMPERT